jgi:hypothetical protein
MRPPKAEEVHLLVCEDVRQEQDGRISLMGVVGPSIEVDTLPGVRGGLCFVLLLMNPAEWFEHIEFTLRDAEGNLIGPKGSAFVPRPNEAGPFLSQHVFKYFPAVFPKAGEYEFRCVFGKGDDDVGLSRKLVVRAKPSDQKTV